MNSNFFYFFTFLIVCFACQPNYLYQEEIILSNATWTYERDVVYSFDIQDTSTTYHLYLDIQHSTQFPFQNLYTNVQTTYPSGRQADSRISIDLANKLGAWYGKCKQENCLLRVQLQQNTFFKELGKHEIRFQQYTRKEALEGVHSLGFIVEQVKE
ncbi:MAG: gliding motility lipoprotein GldH [Bacteroidota bacterium]